MKRRTENIGSETGGETRPSSTVLTKDGVGGVQGGLVLGRHANEPLGIGEGDAGRREAVALVVGDDLAAVDAYRRTIAL
jgi:hypothetical protein